MNPKSLNQLFIDLDISDFSLNRDFTLRNFIINGDDEHIRIIHEIVWPIHYQMWTNKFIVLKFGKNIHISSMTVDLTDNQKLYFKEIEAKILKFFSNHSTFLKYATHFNNTYVFRYDKDAI